MGRGASWETEAGARETIREPAAHRGGPHGEKALTTADRYRFTTIAHAGRLFLGPVSRETVEKMIARLPSFESGLRVIDIGCGKGEILALTLAHTGGSGIGVEPNPAFAAEARARMPGRLESGSVRIVEDPYDTSLLPKGSVDLAICTGAIHAFGDWSATLEGMDYLVAAGGWALLGPGYWKQAPPPEYLAAIGAVESEQDLLPVTIDKAEAAGWSVVEQHESTLEEWDDYEHLYAANMRGWCDAHPDDRDAAAFRERIDKWSAAYERWGRDTMGYALILMRRK